MSYLEANEKIVFLYKFKMGSVPQSFGLNVARLAGIHNEIINKAKLKSQELIDEKNVT
jgi:DNA mismatch repair ATPase MutS